jgi:hypothetical protein
MAQTRRVREVLSGDPGPDYWERKRREGWELAAVEWTRAVDATTPEAGGDRHEVPYGLRVAKDCAHLEPDPEEQRALTVLLSLLIDDGLSLGRVADEMNQRGFRTRADRPWSQKSVFELLPRVVEASPVILESAAWVERKGSVP